MFNGGEEPGNTAAPIQNNAFDTQPKDSLLDFAFGITPEEWESTYKDNEIIRKTRLLGFEPFDMAVNSNCGVKFNQSNLTLQSPAELSTCLFCQTKQCPTNTNELCINLVCCHHWRTVMTVMPIGEVPFYYVTNAEEKQYAATQPGQTRLIFTNITKGPRPYFPAIGLLAIYTVYMKKDLKFLRSLWMETMKDNPEHIEAIMAVFDFIYLDNSPSLTVVRNKWIYDALKTVGTYVRDLKKFVINIDPVEYEKENNENINDNNENAEEQGYLLEQYQLNRKSVRKFILDNKAVSIFEVIIFATFDKSDIAISDTNILQSAANIYLKTMFREKSAIKETDNVGNFPISISYNLDGPIPISPIQSELLKPSDVPQIVRGVKAELFSQVDSREPCSLHVRSNLANKFNMVLNFDASTTGNSKKIKVFSD